MQASDTLLVHQSLAGDRQAFGEIVRRYQSLVCSIGYGLTGNLAAGEELAQEAFIAAWSSLGSLQDPSKLRQWLCGIVRNLANHRARKRSRDILGNAAEIQPTQIADKAACDPVESTMAREEVDLLNRTLAGMPANYREPLVLFYREHHSVARVAELLELKPSAVKQRLARGRAMLRKEVAEIVARGLLRSAPGRAFTVGVLAALPVMSGSAKAATIAVTTAKGVGGMNAAGLAGMLGIILGPLTGILGGWLGYRMSMQSARSDSERAFIRGMTVWVLVMIAMMTVAMSILLYFGRTWMTENPTRLALGISTVAIAYTIGLAGTIVWGNYRIAKIRRENDSADSLTPGEVAARMPKPFRQFQYARVYESKTRLLGVPLVSVQFTGAGGVNNRKPAVGWIAIGDLAYGLVFACGSVAVGGIAFGAVGIGVVSIGGLAIGALALGGGAIGWWTTGGLAMGWCAFGGIALGWKAAIGGMAVAHEFALGGLVVGQHANSEIAKAFAEGSSFFGFAGRLMSPWGWWVLIGAAMLPMLIALKLVPPSKIEAAEEHVTE